MTQNDDHDGEYPEIVGEIDDLKALKFARDLCKLVAEAGLMGWGSTQADAERTAASLDKLIDTAEGLETRDTRFEFLESMLAEDGLAVVIYLKADNVRQALLNKSEGKAISTQLDDGDISRVMQEVLTEVSGPPPAITQWASEMEEATAKLLVTKHSE